jgi:membrane-associated PAP2 superfamily phosphatase
MIRNFAQFLFILALVVTICVLILLSVVANAQSIHADCLYDRSTAFAAKYNAFVAKLNTQNIFDRKLAAGVSAKFRRLEACGLWPVLE